MRQSVEKCVTRGLYRPVTTFFRPPLASRVSVPGPANGSSFSGSFVTTTTASSYGIHMYLMN